MHGVKGANGLYREGAANSRKNRIRDTDEGATTREHLEPACRGAFVGLTQPPGATPAEDGAGRFGQGQRGRDSLPRRANRRPGRRITLQQRRDQRARLDVTG